ncbi:DUF5988 family protein [Sinosporangium siamense]|uniref:Uncharacterized protein n=1 Tax=Sinosporangium siamense TaxID=1367973 RepID=A0A919RM98_9ACTN|nr:DUF5988 family protein [Sinosporangium siamense]GII96173.1 hypothetical protein Ssi02_64040 [Sinosporangium siamense]
MNSTREEDEGIVVILEGGPADLPGTLRVRAREIGDGKIKIPRNGGYEHFERADDSTGPLSYRWTRRTKIAE